ncbi:hypothetical protein CS022_24405 [Veronia nyctiphanis]|uniref:Uncharacterized protein n=1 Tax=Veronia nyctiphanis TaxID=1278244 RepID=A0A4V1LR85_9GAMM|nr:hypothetical protein [Veronia nyctiphanis]RXJ67318.1 hypothetical protein CS022_24405 [Veronia nyctiphanis]
MLEQIHHENWKELSVLTGTAEHVPKAVLGLLAKDRKSFDAAYWKLDNYVVVQGDLFSSAAILPKYLEEVVVKSKFKESVIDLIWQIGTGYSENIELQSTCFAEAFKAFNSLIKHPLIASTKYAEMIKAELDDMVEIEVERKQNT